MKPRRLAQCLDIADLRAAARRRAHHMVFDYIDVGSDDEYALHRNCEAFRDMSCCSACSSALTVDTSTTVLGHKIAYPFLAAPSAANRLFHTVGERAVARAAGDVGTIYGLSTLSSVSIEEVATLTQGPKWFQCYVWRDCALIKEILTRVRAAGLQP